MKLHHEDPEAHQYRVFVDGKQIFDALEADDVTGELLRTKKPHQLNKTYRQVAQVRFEKIVPGTAAAPPNEMDTPAAATPVVSPLAQRKAKEKARREP